MPDALAQQLLALEKSLLDPVLRADSEHVAALLSEDFIEFGSSGRVWSKGTVLEGLATETTRSHRALNVRDLKVKQLADSVALVTYAVERGTDDQRGSLRSSIWKHEDGAWRMVFHQGTIVPEQVTA